ncbi:MAG: universal stress protein [Paludibacter sp.]
MKTNKTKKVLIALDYDPTSKKVAEDGFKMAKDMGAEVTLLHVTVNSFLYTSIYENMGDWQYDSLDTIALRNAGSRNFLEKAKRHLGDTAIQTVMKDGDFAQKILETANEMKADCIVMGSHSQKWLENILVGSVTEEVLRKTTIPMFIVPTKKR